MNGRKKGIFAGIVAAVVAIAGAVCTFFKLRKN